jgi:hypothetical protein
MINKGKPMETTLNIRLDIYEKINHAARHNRISRSDMIILLLKKVMDSLPYPAGPGRMVQYQQKSMPDEWRTFHVSLRMDDYEYFLDLRKIMKMSVSLILAYAVNKYLKQLLRKIDTDNYQFKNYILEKTIIDGIICWKLIWGFPPNLDKFITI